MVPELSLPTQFSLFITIASLATMGLGAAVFLPHLRPGALVREFVRTDWKYLGVAWLVTAVVNQLAHRFHADQTFTWLIYDLEGSIIAAFQSVASTPLTMFFTAVYFVGFPCIVLFTYFKLKVHNEGEARRYALAYLVLVVLAVPFFLLFPVRIPALYPPIAVQPLMFGLSPIIEAGMHATDTMVKAFPSLHTGLALLAALYARKTDKKYSVVASALAGLIVVSTIYLGIHWLTDAGFAGVLVCIAYWVSRRIAPERVFPVPGFDRLRS
jgi:membrane-associated phospholipid phosphatase